MIRKYILDVYGVNLRRGFQGFNPLLKGFNLVVVFLVNVKQIRICDSRDDDDPGEEKDEVVQPVNLSIPFPIIGFNHILNSVGDKAWADANENTGYNEENPLHIT